MSPFESCSECYHFKKWVQGGKEAHFQGISYTNVVTNKVWWANWRKEIYWDKDGSMTGSNEPAFVTPNYPHLAELRNCAVSAAWDDAVICTKGIKVRRLDFWGLEPDQDFRATQVKALTLDG